MTEPAAFDPAAAHEYFSRTCFNQAWDLIVKPDRSPADDEEMIRLNQASLWHWTQRADCSARNLSVGYWQASRIRAILGQAQEAMRYARLCLAQSVEQGPFLLGYAEEALGRAALAAGDRTNAAKHAARARELATAIAEAGDRDLLLSDLATLE
jgi:hypothetical protein